MPHDDPFTPEQLAALARPLDRAHVKTRSQSGQTLSYVEGWHAIAEANRIFGFGAWDRETLETRCVSERERLIGRQQKPGWGVTYVARVRIRVGAIVRDGCGAGHGIDVDPGQAHESALKEAETDAMKRALMTFGNPFGLALYDKEQREVAEPQPDMATLTAQASIVCNRAGLTIEGQQAFCHRFSRGRGGSLFHLSQETLIHICRNGINPETVTQFNAAAQPQLQAQASITCRNAGLTFPGLQAFCSELTGGDGDHLDFVTSDLLARIVSNGISPETVARCNAAGEAMTVAADDEPPATWQTTEPTASPAP